jgi:tetratricopeptide (TPR) repeat protein
VTNSLFCKTFAMALLFGCIAIQAQPPARKAGGTRTSAAIEQLGKRALAARDAGDTTEAIKLFRQGLKSSPTWAEGWWYLGTLFYDLERHAEARDALKRLAVIKADGGPTWALIGLCEFALREYQPALLHLSRARLLSYGGNEQIAFTSNYHYALLLTRFEQYEAGSEVLSVLTRLQPGNPAIVEALGINLLRLSFLPAEVPPEKRELVLRLGRAGSRAINRKLEEKPDEILTEFADLIKDYPKTSNLHYSLGLFLLGSQPDEALAEFQSELQLSPKHVAARLQIAFEYMKRNDFKAGLPYAEQAVQLDPNSFAAHNALGRILLELEQTDRAIKELEAGMKLAPDSPEMHFALARAYSKAGRKPEATKARNEFMRLDKLRRSQRESQVGPTAPETPGNPKP